MNEFETRVAEIKPQKPSAVVWSKLFISYKRQKKKKKEYESHMAAISVLSKLQFKNIGDRKKMPKI